ncbi:winged helix-turn-helix transcriptional regulator [Bacillus luteolus]|uniref:Winged helix-turn-helix transcriptional regulator n=1 Tax=Litchfieldia luteola TaxID=682179 RepID=A0ABR9QGR7_9BACI|nr:winged helix-turn-helix domain-containing protein [Cytobacillus luteolus]MBE4907675.1 winged helix-turn-helix transcriptional regulator [Cytobacillus luteolus]MBP1941126.1 DNA-binding transcriptional ArsR family regulator [Cytobacillus luteolus]
MTYKVEIDFEPIYEVVSSLSVYVTQKTNYDLDKQWFKDVEIRIQPELKKLLKDKESLHLIGYLLLLARKSPYKNSLEKFLSWFKGLSIGEIYELLYMYFKEEPLKDLEHFRNYYATLLPLWDDVYKVDAEINNHLTIIQEVKAVKQNETTPEKMVEECTNGIHIQPSQEITEIILIPTYHLSPQNRIYGFKNTVLIHFSVDIPRENGHEVPLVLLRKTKALADEKRLKILQLLATEPKTFTQLVELTNLSKSNLHYHLVLLRSAGLIRITNFLFTQKPDLYEVRPNIFSAHKEDLEAYVYSGLTI